MLCLLLSLLITSIIGDPVSELAEMEGIMMSLFPYNMLLNPRVGPDQLAGRIAEVFGLDYTPEKPKSDLINAVRPRLYNKVADGQSSIVNKAVVTSQRERKEGSNINFVFHLEVGSKMVTLKDFAYLNCQLRTAPAVWKLWRSGNLKTL